MALPLCQPTYKLRIKLPPASVSHGHHIQIVDACQGVAVCPDISDVALEVHLMNVLHLPADQPLQPVRILPGERRASLSVEIILHGGINRHSLCQGLLIPVQSFIAYQI